MLLGARACDVQHNLRVKAVDHLKPCGSASGAGGSSDVNDWVLADRNLLEQTKFASLHSEKHLASVISEILGSSLEQGWRFLEQVEAIKASLDDQEHLKRCATYMKKIMLDTDLQEQAGRLSEQMDAIAANPKYQWQGLAEASYQKQAKLAAKPTKEFLLDLDLQCVLALAGHDSVDKMVKTSLDGMSDSIVTLIDNLVDNEINVGSFFNRALKVSALHHADMCRTAFVKTGRSTSRSRMFLRSLAPWSAHSLAVRMSLRTFLPDTNLYNAKSRMKGTPVRGRRETVISSAASLIASEGVEKALAFLTIAAAGSYLRPEIRAIMTPEFTQGAQTLMLQAMVPALVFKSLAAVSMSAELIAYIGFGALLAIFRFTSGWAIATGVFGTSQDLGLVRRSSAHALCGMAPATSSYPYIMEFVGPAAVGYSALIDLPNKFFVLFIQPFIVRAWAPQQATGNEEKTLSGGRESVKNLVKALGDPLNFAILTGLAMIATGTKIEQLGFVGKAITLMAEAVTPTLFLILGLRVNLKGSTPALCATFLLLRHGALALFMAAMLAIAGPAISTGIALTVVVMSQSAASIVSSGVINSAIASGVSGYTTEIGIDLCGYSFPFSFVLSAATCVLGTAYLESLHIIGVVFLTAGVALGYQSLAEFRDPKTWSKFTFGDSKQPSSSSPGTSPP